MTRRRSIKDALGEQKQPEVTSSPRRRRSLGQISPPTEPVVNEEKPTRRRKSLGDVAPAPTANTDASASPSRRPRGIGQADLPPVQDTPSVSRTRNRGLGASTDTPKIDALVQTACANDPALTYVSMRLKGRFSTLCGMRRDDVIDWGERNLVALRSVSDDHARIAAKITDLNPSQWISRATDASNADKGLLGKLFGGAETPQYYETRLKGVRDQLRDIARELRDLHDEINPDAEDLRMDIATLECYYREHPDHFDITLVQSRLRTLVSGQQTVVMVMQSLDNNITNCQRHVQTIDQLLQVTIPNWRLAQSQTR